MTLNSMLGFSRPNRPFILESFRLPRYLVLARLGCVLSACVPSPAGSVGAAGQLGRDWGADSQLSPLRSRARGRSTLTLPELALVNA